MFSRLPSACVYYRARARARGTGHGQRYSKSHISHSSVYAPPRTRLLKERCWILRWVQLTRFCRRKYSRNWPASGFRYYFYPLKAGGIYLGWRTRDHYCREYVNLVGYSFFTFCFTKYVCIFSYFQRHLLTAFIRFPSAGKSGWDASSLRTFCSKLPTTTFWLSFSSC